MSSSLPPSRTSREDSKAQETAQYFPPSPGSRASLAGLPTELHLHITQYLSYPDALSLKHTSRHFYYLVDTGVKLKVAWLMERRSLHLDCLNDRRCDLRSDLRFCRGSVKYVTMAAPPCAPFKYLK
ncbi:F-box domain-containing protein [Xylaria palmicola]|nr:F-box domain-containing protein [Xylaria palmicola]